MSSYLVLDGDWLEREIRNAEILKEHAHDTGKPIAIAAASVRLESLKEVRRLAAPALPAGEGPIGMSLEAPPASPAPPDEE